jgi:predicted RNase H-like HicB family nuclease
MMEYAIVVLKLSEADGGGYLAVVPDLYGCMSDGATPAEAADNVQAAIADWIEVSGELGREIPVVGSAARRAKDRENALIETIKILSEQLDGLDNRIERLFSEIEHVRDLMDNQEAWSRFVRLVHVDYVGKETTALPC